MENASKALLIAGSILVCILLIAVGMYVFNGARSAAPAAIRKMDEIQKNAYNAVVNDYIKDKSTLSGADVKSMIAGIQAQNTEYLDESGKFISIEVKGHEGDGGKRKNLGDDVSAISNYSNGDALRDKCKAANWWDKGDNTKKKVEEANDEMDELRKKINSGDTYKVTADTDAGVVIRVHIGLIKD